MVPYRDPMKWESRVSYQRLTRRAHDMGLLGEMSAAQFERELAGISSQSVLVVVQGSFAAGEVPAIMQPYRWRDTHDDAVWSQVRDQQRGGHN